MAKTKKAGGSGGSRSSRAKTKTTSARKSTRSNAKKPMPKGAKADGSAIGGPETFDPGVFEGMLGSFFGGGRKARGAKDDALYHAQQLCYQAMETRDPRRRVELAKHALAISPDCADAYVLLAQMTDDVAEATDLNGLAVEAGMNAIGPDGW